MAKDHLLPRYLLRAAVCVCVLLGFGFLAVFHAKDAKDAKALRLFAKDAKDISLPPFANDSMRALREPTLREIYTAEIGIRETSGNNDGSRVGEYLRYCGLDEGYAWCAAFVSWCHGQAGYTEPRNAWSPALFPLSRMIWSNDKGTRSKDKSLFFNSTILIPKEGDVFGIYYTNLKRIAHAGFVDGWDGKYCVTVEGNTGPEGAIGTVGDPANPIRAGPARDGVYRKRRPIRTIKAIARWAQ